LTPTGTFRETLTWVATSATSSLPRGRVFRRRSGLLPLREGLRSKVSDQESRRYGLPAEPTCRLASGRRTVGLISRSKRVGRLCDGYRVICLRPDPARRAYTTGWGPPQNRKCRSPAYESPSRRGDLAPPRVRTATDFFPSLPPFVRIIHIILIPVHVSMIRLGS